ncbi:glycosyl transferase [Rhizobium sp. Root1220]|uniref:GH36-type glycosyl hydrolase domain-containing protein n=1 Tax=Rhizobium sp. Root1220 TaxID=1736432 RepID=UPI0006FCF975|nr:glycosyl transferase [Rhizobium sp. Root1220]KQV66412.1 glycosyl transferase [Rhizobium sp. Root1220]
METDAESNRHSAGAPPSVALLSNGRYCALVTESGAGYASWSGLDVTRWHEDGTRDCWGQFCYIRDLDGNEIWSVGKQPLHRADCIYEHLFEGDRAELRCSTKDIDIRCTIGIASDCDAEVRLLRISNLGSTPKELELTSYSEVCLNDRRADSAHPAFAKLFVETWIEPETGALFARRRPRSINEKPVWAVHVSASSAEADHAVEYDTDRYRFLGRGRTLENPIAFDGATALSATTGPVLDPIFSLRRTLHLQPGATEWIAFVTGAADSEATARQIAERFSRVEAADRTFSDTAERTCTHSPEEIALYYELASSLVYAHPGFRDSAAFLSMDLKKDALWSRGISGDLPILLVRIDATDEPLVQDAIDAHGFLSARGLSFDLVLLDERGARQAQELTEQLTASQVTETVGKPGGHHILATASMPDKSTSAIVAAARVVVSCSRGSLAEQLRSGQATASLQQAPPAPGPRDTGVKSRPLASADLLYWNGFGGFSPDGRQYVIATDGAARTPTPWCNVIANRKFGCLTGESGLGYTWSGNSQLNRLTPWSNDPVSDPHGEVIYLRDEQTGKLWTPTPLPLGASSTCTVGHGQGYSRYESDDGFLHHEMTVHVPISDPLKVVHLVVRNSDTQTRHLTATYFLEWVLGSLRDDAAMRVACELDVRSNAIIAWNVWQNDFFGKMAFVASSAPVRSVTCDRSEFLGTNGSVSRPAGLARSDLSGNMGPLIDPCAALMVDLAVAPGQSAEVVFVLGQADSRDGIRRLVEQYADPARARDSLATVSRDWDRILSTVTIRTPDRAFDLMMNRWLLYQVLACRVWARSAFYQSGGAYGFRDQLQDVMALVHCAPEEARSHILRAASRQFEEGDVQHWWHPPSGVGVRTRITDDLYFLPYVVHHYVSVTGDHGLLDERVPFIASPVLKSDQEETFGVPQVSRKEGTVYEHCCRALEHGLRLGRHGLPLMGTGDWNDGMNKVGAEGRGESVWNGWFFVTVLRSFAVLASASGDESRAEWCHERSDALRAALETHAWDGDWYRRAYFDDGTPLGSRLNDECQIDAIPQAWAVISGVADGARASTAMKAVWNRLVRPDDKLIQLFDPPFDKGPLQPGYIKGYVPGIRENGGQYTHAAAWVVLATALLGDGDRALELWHFLNPISHAQTKSDAEHYMVEPYVVTADIYGAQPHTGRGGWTWYTGSAGWLYRVGLEAILGIRRQDQFLLIDPCIPRDWPEFELDFRHGTSTYRIHVDNSFGTGGAVSSLILDGKQVSGAKIPLSDDGSDHTVHAIIGSP